MRIYGLFLTVSLSLSTFGCEAMKNSARLQVAYGSYLLSYHTLKVDEPAAVQMGGKVFRINKNVITWDRGGSAVLPTGWGLLELEETPNSILVKPDGVQVAEVAK